MTKQELDALSADIVATYGTTYKFIQTTGLPRSTVYCVLAGKYAGDVEKVAAKIRSALWDFGASSDACSLDESALKPIEETLAAVACARCRNKDKRRCRGCKNLFRSQALAIVENFSV